MGGPSSVGFSYSCVAAVGRARPRPLAEALEPAPPLARPSVEFPPPVSFMPRLRLDAVASEALLDGDNPAVSPPLPNELSEPKLSVHSPIWSLMFDSWLLICDRFDHRNKPAAAAPAATAAAAIGLSRAISMTPPVLPLARLPELPRLLPLREFLAIFHSPQDEFASTVSTTESGGRSAPGRRRAVRSGRMSASGRNAQAVASWSSIVSALDARYSPGCSTFSCSTTPSLMIIE